MTIHHVVRVGTISLLVQMLPSPASAQAQIPKPRLDAWGDALPTGAIARLGSLHFWHGTQVGCVAVSPDGMLIATAGGYSRSPHLGGGFSASPDYVLRLWDAATGKEIRNWRTPHCDRLLAFSADGKKLVSVSEMIVCLWDVGTGKELRREKMPGYISYASAPSGGKQIALGVNYDTLCVQDLETGKETRVWKAFAGPRSRLPNGEEPERCVGMALSPDGQTFAWGITQLMTGNVTQASHIVRIHDAARGKLLRVEDVGTECRILTFSKDGTVLAVGMKGLRLIEVATGKVLQKTGEEAGAYNISTLVFSPDGKVLASGHDGRRLLLWDVASGRRVHALIPSHPKLGDVVSRMPLAFAADDKTLIACTWGTVRKWEVATGKELLPLPGHSEPVQHLHFSPDGSTLTSNSGPTFCHWNTKTWKEVGRSEWPQWYYQDRMSKAHSFDGKHFVGRDEQDGLLLREIATGRSVRRLMADPEYYLHGFFSPDGKRVAIWFQERGANTLALNVFDVTDGKQLGRLPLVGGRNCPSLSPGGWRAAWAGDDGTLYVGDVAAAKVGRLGDGLRAKEIKRPPDFLVFSGDGQYLAAANFGYSYPKDNVGEYSVGVWRLKTEKEILRLLIQTAESKRDCLACLAFSADGRTLATRHHTEPFIRLWEVASGRERRRLPGHAGRTLCLAFSADGNTLASGGEDGTILIWDLNITVERAAKGKLTAADLDLLWADLANDPPVAERAINALSNIPETSVSLLQGRLQPVEVVPPERLARLIADLGDTRFSTRQKAAQELEQLSESAEAALIKALSGNPELEVRRRIQELLDRLRRPLQGARLRELRALQVLERVGNPVSRKVLETLAAGDPAARLTLEAQASLLRRSDLR